MKKNSFFFFLNVILVKYANHFFFFLNGNYLYLLELLYVHLFLFYFFLKDFFLQKAHQI